jgi:hypothetical protein
MDFEPTLTQAIVFSDSVIREHGSNKLSLIGTFHQFNVPRFPFQAPPFFITVFLTNIRGKLEQYKISVRIEEKASGYVVASAAAELNSPNEVKSTETIQIPFGIFMSQFPSAGLYNVVALAQNESIGSRDLVVNSISAIPNLPNT